MPFSIYRLKTASDLINKKVLRFLGGGTFMFWQDYFSAKVPQIQLRVFTDNNKTGGIKFEFY